MGRRADGKNPRKRIDSAGRVRWQARIVTGINPSTGRRQYTYETFDTKDAAESWLTRERARVQSGDWTDPGKVTAGDLLSRWRADNEAAWAPRTAERYRSVIGHHILAKWRFAPIASVKTSAVQAWLLGLRSQGRLTWQKNADGKRVLVRGQGGLSVASLRYIRSAMHQAFAAAVTDGLLSRNPIDAVRLPQVRQAKVSPMTIAEIRAVIEASRGHRLHAFFVLALTTGARAGELLGARWEDFDLDAGRWEIKHTLQRVKGKGLVLGPPKTETSERTVRLPAAAVAALVSHRKRQAEERLKAGSLWRDGGFVFATHFGTPLEEGNVYHRVWRPVLESAGVQPRRLHDARHSHASLLVAQGEPLKLVQERLGHAVPRTTVALYVHLYADAHEQAANRLDALLTGKRPADEAK